MIFYTSGTAISIWCNTADFLLLNSCLLVVEAVVGKAMVGWLVKRLQRPSVPWPPALDGCHGWILYKLEMTGDASDLIDTNLYQIVGQRMNQIRSCEIL